MRALLLLILVPLFAQAENTSTTGSLSFLSLAKKLSPYSTLTFYHYDVTTFEKKVGSGREFPAGLVQTYFQTAYTYQYLPALGLTLGHIFQLSNPLEADAQKEHRIFEQVTLGATYRNFTASHRVRFEQRFIEAEFRTRLRYQLGAKVPLRGLAIDAGEFYLNTYNEVYLSTTGERNAFLSDDWAYVGVGLRTADWGSFELGPLVQWSRVNREKDTRTQYNLQVGWLVNF